MADQIKIEILEDGTIKADTGKISALNHSNAEAFMRELNTVGGGLQVRKHKAGMLGNMQHEIQHALGKAH